MILVEISTICYVTFILLLWFESDIVTTISKLTGTGKLLKIPEFEQYTSQEDLMCTYPNFIHSRYNSWWSKLISCSICLTFWCTILSLAVIGMISDVNVETLLLMFPINYISTRSLYLYIKTHL
jgi:hypothetical protein